MDGIQLSDAEKQVNLSYGSIILVIVVLLTTVTLSSVQKRLANIHSCIKLMLLMCLLGTKNV